MKRSSSGMISAFECWTQTIAAFASAWQLPRTCALIASKSPTAVPVPIRTANCPQTMLAPHRVRKRSNRRGHRAISEGDPMNVATTQATAPDPLGALHQRIEERTWGRVKELRVERRNGRIVVYGSTPCYYVKQLVL